MNSLNISSFYSPDYSLAVLACPRQKLINARLAYQHASTGQAAQLVPAELAQAQSHLTLQRNRFQNDPNRSLTIRYLAMCRSQS